MLISLVEIRLKLWRKWRFQILPLIRSHVNVKIKKFFVKILKVKILKKKNVLEILQIGSFP